MIKNTPEFFQFLLVNTSATIFVIAAKGLVYVSPAVETLTGYTADELLAIGDTNIFLTPESRTVVLKNMTARYAGEAVPERYPVQYLTKNGELRWLEVNATRITLEDEPATLVTAFDITEHVQSEKALQEQHDFTEALRDIAALLTSTLEVDEIFNRMMANVGRIVPHKTADLFLLEADTIRIAASHGYETEYKTWVHQQHFKLDEIPLIQQVIEDKQVLVFPDIAQEPRWRRYEPTAWIASVILMPIQIDQQGIGCMTLNSDKPGFFTEAHSKWLQVLGDQAAIAIHNARLYNALEHQRAQLQAILDSTGDAICYVQEITIAYANQTYALMTGYAAEELIGQPISRTWIDYDEHSALIAEMQAAVISGAIWRREMRLRGKNRSPVSAALTVTRVDTNPLRMVATIRDISQEKQLRHRQSQFIGHIAHELRNPLTSLSNRLFLMRRQPAEVDKHLQTLDEINRRISRLVDAMQEFFRLEQSNASVQLTRIEINSVVTKQVETAATLWRTKQIAVDMALLPYVRPFYADESRIMIMLDNLLTYIISNMPVHGLMSVLSQQVLQEIWLDIRYTGKPVLPHQMPFIFDPFNHSSAGDMVHTGLELAIARRIAELHGWQINFESIPNFCNQFRIIIPQAKS